MSCSFFSRWCQARRQGGVRGVRTNPPFDLQKILYAPLNCTFQVSYRLSTSLAAIENHRCPNESGCSYSTGVCEFVHGGPSRNARVTSLRRCDERTRVITCVNKLLVHALESCPSSEVTPWTSYSANLSTFS